MTQPQGADPQEPQDLPQGPPNDATGGPQQPSAVQQEENPPELGLGTPPGPQAPSLDIDLPVRQAIVSLATAAKAFSTGEPIYIDAQKARDFAHGAFYLMQGLAQVDPPAAPLAAKDALRGQLDANKALLQDHQHSEQMATQLETARQREGRPQGPSKP